MANSLDTRIARLERIAIPRKLPSFKLYIEHDGILERTDENGALVETMTRAQFDALPGEKIYIEPQEEDEDDEDE